MIRVTAPGLVEPGRDDGGDVAGDRGCHPLSRRLGPGAGLSRAFFPGRRMMSSGRRGTGTTSQTAASSAIRFRPFFSPGDRRAGGSPACGWRRLSRRPRAAPPGASRSPCRRTASGGAAVRAAPGQVRVAADLRAAGWRVSESTVAGLMRELGLAARRRRKRRPAARPGRGRRRAPDLVRRDFPAAKINRKWYGDGTGIATAEGKLCLGSVWDMASRRVLGFALSGHHDAAGLRRAGNGGGGPRRRRARRDRARRARQRAHRPGLPPGVRPDGAARYRSWTG